MRRSWLFAVGALVLLTAVPAAVEAQSRTCRQVLPSDARRLFNSRGQELIYFRDPVRVLCTGGVQLEADSAVMNRGNATVELVGNVLYRDTTRELTAEWANYLGRNDQLLARGDVVLRDVDAGSTVTGDQLEYLREGPDRPVARMMVRGGRPHAVIPRGEAETARPDTLPPIEVWADEMEFEGETIFRGQGDVQLERGEMRGAGQSARFDQLAEEMTLIGAAWVENESYRLEGERIDAYLDGEALREVLADRRTRLRSDELDVRSERLRIGFVGGELDRLEAWNPDPSTAPRRADATSEDFRLSADSIDARSEAGELREVRAVGRAFGERQSDSVDVALPETIARDWIQGDTIIGYFVRAATAPADDAAPVPGRPDRREFVRDTALLSNPEADIAPGSGDGAGTDTTGLVLERIEVVGGSAPALSLYRMEPGSAGGGAPSINFMKAARIVLFMEGGEVSRVEAEGPIEGMYLDPSTGRPRGPGAGPGASATGPSERGRGPIRGGSGGGAW